MSGTLSAEQLFAAAMILSPEQRRLLADRLYFSVEQELDVESEAFLRMIEARDAAADSGELRTYSWDEVCKMLPRESQP